MEVILRFFLFARFMSDDVPVVVFNDLAETFARIATDPATPATVVQSCLVGVFFATLLAPHTDGDAPAHPTIVLPTLAKFFTSYVTPQLFCLCSVLNIVLVLFEMFRNVGKTDCEVVGTSIEAFTMLCANGYLAQLKRHVGICMIHSEHGFTFG